MDRNPLHPSCGKTTLAEAIQSADLAAWVAGTGSLFRHHFRPKPPANDGASCMDGEERTVLEIFISSMCANGTMIAKTGGGVLSTAMEKAEIGRGDRPAGRGRAAKPAGGQRNTIGKYHARGIYL